MAVRSAPSVTWPNHGIMGENARLDTSGVGSVRNNLDQRGGGVSSISSWADRDLCEMIS